MQIQTVILLISIGVTIPVAYLSWVRRKNIGAISLIVFSGVVIFWSVLILLAKSEWTLSQRLALEAVYLGPLASASVQIIFLLTYSQNNAKVRRLTVIFLAGYPLITRLMLWATKLHAFFPSNQLSGIFDSFQREGSRIIIFIYNLDAIYLYGLGTVSMMLVINILTRKEPFKSAIYPALLLLTSIVPLSLHLTRLVGLSPLWAFELFPFAYSFVILGLYSSLLNDGALIYKQLERNTVVQLMSDGWMITDKNNRIVDINPALEKMMSMPLGKNLGKPAHSIFKEWNNLLESDWGIKQFEFKRSFKVNEEWRYFQVRILPLYNQDNEHLGHASFWQDITNRKSVEEARQRARDEMFILLNSISSTAVYTSNLEDFLSETTNQIIYPFQSQAIAYFLVGENNKTAGNNSIALISHYGLSAREIEKMTEIPLSSSLLDWVMENKKGILLDDLQNNDRVPSAIQNLNYCCILFVPLINTTENGSRVMGCMCLARKEHPIYSNDEVFRINIIADHIATLIDNDQRKKLAIALSERTRLLMDLHDSVSQKLYGLVSLTEAAQASLEAGVKFSPKKTLSQIGENARQAVKEMRLFLHQTQPVDLEKDGLVSALNQRLAAVEGRADIKARVLADENLALSKEKEIAFYYVAQEALNNVMRHAHAKSVTVTLKQQRQNVILEVEDDGRGFDLKKVKQGGFGLSNMKERATQINGKLVVDSKIGGGTKIKLVTSREPRSNPYGRRRQVR